MQDVLHCHSSQTALLSHLPRCWLARLPVAGDQKCSFQQRRSTQTRGRPQEIWGCQAAVELAGAVSADKSAQVSQLKRWLEGERNVGRDKLKLQYTAGLYSSEEDFRTVDAVKTREVLLELPAELGVTATDAHSDSRIAELTEGRSELVCLALWLISERAKGAASAWQVFLDTLPQQTDSPILWSEAERRELLRGSPVQNEAASRASAVDAEWDSISTVCSTSQEKYSPGAYQRLQSKPAERGHPAVQQATTA